MISIEKAKIGKCREIALVKRQVWESAYRGIYPDAKIDGFDIEKETEKFCALVSSEQIDLYVAKAEDKIVGYMAYGKNPRHIEAESDELVLLSILKEWQGKGIGRQLFDYAKELLQNKGADRMELYCNKYNLPAQAFYKKMGCQVVSIDPDNTDKSIPQIKFIYAF